MRTKVSGPEGVELALVMLHTHSLKNNKCYTTTTYYFLFLTYYLIALILGEIIFVWARRMDQN